MEQQNIDDESYEMVIRQDFGAAWVAGKFLQSVLLNLPPNRR